MTKVEWSDAFFNYVPAEQAFSEAWAKETGNLETGGLLEAAKQFLEVNNTCPMTAEQLVKDFVRRV